MAIITDKKISKQIYSFGKGETAPPLDKNLLGGKGKGLAEMASLGMPVPPGFIITTEVCNRFRQLEGRFPDGFEEGIWEAIKRLESQMGSKFGDERNPLLVSVRSGARVSMPGMMDTVLNLGLNDQSVEGFAELTKNAHLAYDSYRRLILIYSDVVCGISRKLFEKAFDLLKNDERVENDFDLSVNGLKQACQIFKQIFEQQTGKPFPQDAKQQLLEAIKAVFNSWDSERAVLYRTINHISDEWGTSATIQTMVFGNRNEKSATGVGFSRDPATGENKFYGEFLLNAQGEEVVAGTRTPHPINLYQKAATHSSLISLEEMMPAVYQELLTIVKKLEAHFTDVQDIEFTIDDGKLYMLQTRTGKRTGFAAVRVAMEMLDEKLIDEKTVLTRVQPEQLIQLLSPIFDIKAKLAIGDKLAATGLNAGPGAASGKLALSKEKAIELKQRGEACILVREETNPDDFPGMVAADGILTLRGGSTSHAAVVARGMGKPCVVGCGALSIDLATKELTAPKHVGKLTIKEEEFISIDGFSGEVFFSPLTPTTSEVIQVLISKTKHPSESLLYRQYQRLMEIADKYRTLKIRANADTPNDCSVSRLFGCDGIGLCRTEHMFLDPTRLNDVRCLFFSQNTEDRQKAIDRLLQHQKEDFIEIFRVMHGMPVTIRLLDPPLHEFMPHTDDELKTLAAIMHIPYQQLLYISASLEEQNPMLGHRGCRLGIAYPEVTKMQARAIFEAAIAVAKEGSTVIPEIMVPLVGIFAEFEHQKLLIDLVAKEVFTEQQSSIPYLVGTMIELPRAALIADKIAKIAEFFSFGTNDLTQTTFGISRDDSAKFVPLYIEGVSNPLHPSEKLRILIDDPFQTIDQIGVGELMKIAIERGKRSRPGIKCGICGEHGGDPQSVIFCHQIGLDYVSCSPYRIPVARLAAAIPVLQDSSV